MKKILTILLIFLLLACFMTATVTVALAAEGDGTEGDTATGDLKVVHLSLANLFPDGYTANTPIIFKDGDAVIGTLKIDRDSTTSLGSKKVAQSSIFSFVPGDAYVVQKLILGPTNSLANFKEVENGYSTPISSVAAADKALIEQAGVSGSGSFFFGVQFDDAHTATEDAPYQFQLSMNVDFATVSLIYQEGSHSETVATNKNNCSNIVIGDGAVTLSFDRLGYTGTSSITLNENSKLYVAPAPGYIITSIEFSTSLSATSQGYLKLVESSNDLTCTSSGTTYTLTGFQVGQSYEITSTFYGRQDYCSLYSITVNYESHVHEESQFTANFDETSHWDECVCKAKINEEEHTLVAGEITAQPGAGLPGKQLYTCEDCAAEIEKAIPCPITDEAITATLANQLIYTGNAQEQKVLLKVGETELVEGVDYTLSDNVNTDAGTYEMTVSATGDRYEGSFTLQYTIAKASVNKPAPDTTEYVYDKTLKTYQVEASDFYTVSGETKQMPGTYVVTIALNDTTNYQWEDGTTDDLAYDFIIQKGVVALPALDATKFVYNGSVQTYFVAESDLYTVSGSQETYAGTYTVTITLKAPRDYQWETGSIVALKYEFVIHKAIVEKPAEDTSNFVYNGAVQTYTVATSELYTVSNTTATLAGTHTVKISLNDKNNYQWDDESDTDLSYAFLIAKATYAWSGVIFADKTVTYNGTAFSVEATNLPSGVSVTYENNAQTAAGTYTVVAKFSGDADNYNAIPDMSATLIINKATYNMSGITFADVTLTYDGNAHSLSITGTLPNGVNVTYENNNQTNAGTHTVVAKFTGDANYNAIPNMTATLVINKATYDMSGVTFAGNTVTYNGTAFSLTATNLPNGVTASYENNGKTNVGTYTVTAKFTGNANYNAIPDMTATIVINKATYNMSGVTFADNTATYNGSAFSLAATNLPQGVSVAYEGNDKTEPGTYTVTAKFTGNANYNAIPDMTATLVINKATYDMSGVVFANKTVTHNGTAFSIEATNLPEGVTVTYEGNGKTEPGKYTVTAKFACNANYNAIPDMQAVLTVKKAAFNFQTSEESTLDHDFFVSTEAGVDPDANLSVELIEVETSTEQLAKFLEKDQKIGVAYDVKLLKDGASVQPDGTLKFKVLIPAELKGKDFAIMHIHAGTEKTMLEYEIEGDFAVFETDKLSEFVFVYETGSLLWLLILLAAIVMAEVAVLLFLMKKKGQLKGVKLSAVYPPFVFGMFVPEWHIVCIAILGALALALAAVDVLYASKLVKNGCPVVAIDVPEEEFEEVEEEEEEQEADDTRKMIVGVVWAESSKTNKIYRYNVLEGRIKEGDTVIVPTFDQHRQKEIVRKARVVSVEYYEEGDDVELPSKAIISKEKKLIRRKVSASGTTAR